jgi:peroxiredoxin
MTVDVGDPAPDPNVRDRYGAEVSLSRTWAERPAVLAFLRHFGRAFCREQVVQLRDDRERFEGIGISVALIGLGRPEQASLFCDRRRITFDWPTSPDRSVHRAFGLRRGTLWKVVAVPATP